MQVVRSILLVAALLVCSGHARAADKALAEQLFNQGVALMEAGRTAEACAKFAASNDQDPSSGTALNLARCHETLGRTASAWAEYEEAARLADVQGRQDRVAEARARADALKPTLSYLTIHVEAPAPKLVVSLDGVQIPPAAWDAPLPVDPGSRTLVASAPGFEARTFTVSVSAEPSNREVAIPALVPVVEPKAAPPEPEVPPTPPAQGKPNRVPAYVVGGAGAVFLIAGAIFGIVAKSTYDSAKALCGGVTTDCPADAVKQRSNAELYANLSNVGFGLGIAGLGVGTVLFFTARPKATSSARLVLEPRLGPSMMGASLGGAF